MRPQPLSVKILIMSFIVETSYFGNFTQADDPKITVIPCPYEYTPSIVKGTKNGPQAILNASTHLEKFDDELWTGTSIIGINTTNFLNCEYVTNKSKEPFSEVEQAVRNTIIGGSLPILIGGEQSISFGSIKTIYDLYPDVSILYFSARPCLKDIHAHNKYSSPCTMRRIHEIMPDLKIIQAGIRSISEEEANWVEGNTTSIEIFFAKDKNKWSVTDLISNLTKNVFICFNFNALDSNYMPSCSFPEPGGLSYELVLDILKNVCAFKDIVGMDFVECAPNLNLQAPDLLAAKLIYKTIGYTFARQLGVFEEEKDLQPATSSNILCE